jgi:hypothetical protein
VLGGVIDLNGLEGAGPYVQEYIRSTDPRSFDAIEQLGREVKPRGRRRDGTGFASVNGLIPRLI